MYDLATDPSEAKNVAAEHADVVAKLSALAEKAHAPVMEGTFERTDRHERDRRAKFHKQDETAGPEKPQQPRKKGNAGKKKEKKSD